MKIPSPISSGMRRTVLAVALVGLGSAALVTLTLRADAQMADADLDVCVLKPTFAEDFDTLRVASRVLDDKTWIAHTPWNGDFGDAIFTDPGRMSPFSVEDGILSITASRDTDGKWRSGLLAATDAGGNGFSQMYGYFEARMKLPEGAGLWPAFWLGVNQRGNEKKNPALEIDVIEHYGHAPGAFTSSLHLWHKSPPRDEAKHHTTKVPEGSLYEDFHTYGVKVDPEHITTYLDRKPIWQVETPPEHRSPLYPLVNLAMGSGFPIDETPDPSILLVDYVHVFDLEPGAKREGCEP